MEIETGSEQDVQVLYKRPEARYQGSLMLRKPLLSKNHLIPRWESREGFRSALCDSTIAVTNTGQLHQRAGEAVSQSCQLTRLYTC
jgi:hypothetical protein